MLRPADHYATLGVARDASGEAIRAAYVARIKACHPDFATAPDAYEQFQQTRIAYDCLRSPERRACYDRDTAAFVEWQLSRVGRAQRRLRKLDRRLPATVVPAPAVPHWRAAAVVAAGGSLVLSACYLLLR